MRIKGRKGEVGEEMGKRKSLGNDFARKGGRDFAVFGL